MIFNTSPYVDGCWIGINDLSSEGTYVWIDGSDSTYRHWNPGEPHANSYSIYDAVFMGNIGTWVTTYQNWGRPCSICRINNGKCWIIV